MNDTSLPPRGGLRPGRWWPILLALLPLAPARAQCPASVGSAWLESGDVMTAALPGADWWLGPNPSDGSLAVRLSPGAAERLAGGRWVLLDAFGRRLAEGPVASGTLLDGAGLGAGAYRLQWRDAAGRPAGGRTWIRR